MIVYFIFRVISAIAAFLYPGYASYKTLSQRPASEVELERWLMYWCVLGCIVFVEYIAEWLVSWFPFYYPIKTIFLLYLALPQTSGSSYLYKAHVQPFFSSHESEIDSALSQFKSVVYIYLQQLARSLWSHVASTIGQQPGDRSQGPDALDEGGITSEAAVNTGAPPSIGDPVSGPIQLAQTFWRSYGPSIIASGAGFLQQSQRSMAAQPPATPTSAAAFTSTSARPSAPPRQSTTQSVLDRRRQLEAELASLPQAAEGSSPSQGYDLGGGAPYSPPPILIPPADSSSRSSSSSSLIRERSGSGNGKSTFEEVEVPSDMEGEGHVIPEAPAQARRSSWFWGSGQSKDAGYERLKSD